MNDKQKNAFDLSSMSGLGLIYQRKIMETHPGQCAGCDGIWGGPNDVPRAG